MAFRPPTLTPHQCEQQANANVEAFANAFGNVSPVTMSPPQAANASGHNNNGPPPPPPNFDFEDDDDEFFSAKDEDDWTTAKIPLGTRQSTADGTRVLPHPFVSAITNNQQ